MRRSVSLSFELLETLVVLIREGRGRLGRDLGAGHQSAEPVEAAEVSPADGAAPEPAVAGSHQGEDLGADRRGPSGLAGGGRAGRSLRELGDVLGGLTGRSLHRCGFACGQLMALGLVREAAPAVSARVSPDEAADLDPAGSGANRRGLERLTGYGDRESRRTVDQRDRPARVACRVVGIAWPCSGLCSRCALDSGDSRAFAQGSPRRHGRHSGAPE